MTMAAKGVAKLIEECGELQQVLGKKLAWWDTDDPHWDGSDLEQRMAEEIGDVMAACEFVASMFGIHAEAYERRDAKVKLFAHWHVEDGNNEHGIDGP
jgi:NTP pyrophosphatase (non-canonical NTP hydrolase)